MQQDIRPGALWDEIDRIVPTHLRSVRIDRLPWLAIYKLHGLTKGVVQDVCTSSDQPPTHLVTIQGQRSRTSADLLSTWADALEFPNYYGQNWDAFDECFADLLQLPTGSGLGSMFGDRPGRFVTRLVVQVHDAQLLLTEEPDWNLKRFIQLLDGLRNDPLRRSRTEIAEFLIVLFVSTHDDPENLLPDDFTPHT